MDASKATSRSARCGEAVGLCVAALLLALPAAGQWQLGGDARYYQFVRVDEAQHTRREAELGIFRLKLAGQLSDEVTADAHGVASLTSPATTIATSIASGTTRRLVELQHTARAGDDFQALLEIDRLSVTWERPSFRLVVGRQAITWGVNYFWPALDLFAPFSPERIDREYKPGVDALRLTLPVGEFSQLEVVAAGQGNSLRDDGSVGGLARVHLGAADVGCMAGRFHGDTVAGGFLTADVRGTGVRGEVAFTDSGDSFDAVIHREHFWRASAGIDRQLTATLEVTAELAWNGFGVSRASAYPLVAATDRVRRGEVNALGQHYAGASLSWQAHPLLSLVGAGLANLDDGSVLLLPHADWSLSDSLSAVFGGAFSIGSGLRADGTPATEYGAAPQALYAAIKVYF
jgi:hypothetical protein